MINFNRLGRKAILLGAVAPLALALGATSAFAQQAGAAAAADTGTEVGEVVVTGTLFKRTTVETASPVTTLTTETLQQAGITTATDAIRSISADSAGSIGTGFQSGFSAGGAAVSLRGLGVSSTLVLIDGLRSTNYPLNDDGHNAYVDLNSIPFSMVERVEVLKDGASSTYGADAIGGVVNLIMKKKWQGIAGMIEGGATERHDGGHSRAEIKWGFGDYDKTGWNLILGAEYQVDGKIRHHDVGFPYNNRDLTSIGGNDGNAADNSLTANNPDAKVTRVAQTDLNNPFSGGVPLLIGNTTAANVATLFPAGPDSANPAVYVNIAANCKYGVFNVSSGSSIGQGCKHNLEDEYLEVQPHQDRWAFNGRLNVRLTDKIEAYATGSYSRDYVNIHRIPQSIRATQPFGASPALSSSSPGIVLPVYICSSGVNCATDANRQLNPNNPFAAAYAADPSNGAARIYYQFGDVVSGSTRKNEVYRGAAGFTGDFMDWNWHVDGVAARDSFLVTDEGYFNIAALKQAINTGSYNFVDPSKNSAALRNSILPDVQTPSHSLMYSLDAAATHTLFMLPGGEAQLAIGGQIRHEELENNNRNACLCTGNLTTSAAFGKHDVRALYFEVDAPVMDKLNINLSGRYDDYSEGFSHFSPKIGVKWTPIKQFAIRGTYSQGFRAPTFAESNPRSGFAGFSTFNLPTSFQNVHGGTIAGGNTNSYLIPYQLGQGLVGNPDLKPEISDSYTLGFIAQPLSWLSATVDYYHVKKDKVIVAGPLGNAVKTAYYANANATVAQACAAVAAVGAGYSCNTVDSVDPLFPNALPRLLIFNAPFVNAGFLIQEGIDAQVTGKFHLPGDSLLTSRLEVTKVLKADLHASTGVQKYAGTLGPYELSSGNGTPDLRANWQNSFNWKQWTVSATTYWVDKIKEVATDEGSLSRDCIAHNLYTSNATQAAQFCYVKAFIYTDANASYEIKPGLTAYVNVGNVFGRKAPVAPAAYSSAPNYLITWDSAGVIGRTYKAGLRFNF